MLLFVVFLLARRRHRSPEPGPAAQASSEEAPRLKEREQDVLRLLSNGYTTSQIAEALHLSDETIRW
ncbi:MAG: hypothetical protein IJL91_06235, partial [Bacteroidales bacterium]|nr:hypothetical protein [Bacteroidales bacterium]